MIIRRKAQARSHRFYEGEGGSGEGSGSGDGGGAGGEGGSGEGAPDGSGSGSGSGGDASKSVVADLQKKVETLTTELKQVTGESIGRKKVLQKFEELGITPEKAEQLVREQAERQREQDEAQGNYEKVLNEERARTAEKEAAHKATLSEYHSSMQQRDILAAASKHGVTKESAEALVEGGKSQIETVLEAVTVYDPETRTTYHKTETNEDGSRMTVEQFIAKERTGKLANHFQSQMRGGGDGAGGSSDGNVKTVKISRTAHDRLAQVEKAEKDGAEVEYVD